MVIATIRRRTFYPLPYQLLGGPKSGYRPPKILKKLVYVSLCLLILSGLFYVSYLPACTPDRRGLLSRYALVALRVTPLSAPNGSLAARFAWGRAASPRRVALAFWLRERQIANPASLNDISLNMRWIAVMLTDF